MRQRLQTENTNALFSYKLKPKNLFYIKYVIYKETNPAFPL
jgi:hypothetical protein